MKSKFLIVAMLTTSTLSFSGSAFAQAAQADADTKVQQEAPQTNEELATRAAFLEAQVQALQEALNDLKAQVTKTTPQWSGTGKPQWWESTSITGRMYFNISSIKGETAAGVTNEKDGAYQIKRFYIGIDHKFSNIFAGNVTMDVDNVVGNSGVCGGGAGACNLVGKGFYIKKAYLEAKLDPALIIRLGAADTPWIPYAEGIYGYRHIDKTISDLDSFGTSSDWGVHVMGTFAGGIVSYQVSAVDGGGYRNPQLTKTVDLEGRVSVQYKGFNAAIGGYVGKLGNDKQGAVTFHTAKRFNALVAYKDKIANVPVTIGAEYFHAKDWKRVTSVTEDSSDGYSIFASVSPIPMWSVFGRYDWVKPSKDLNPLQKDHYFNIGVQYSPVKIVDLALVYKRDSADGGLIIGNLTSGQATRDEFGVYGQFRF